MAIEYAKNQGRRDFMDLIIADFQVRYPGVPPPSRFTIYRQFQKLDLYHILHYLNSKVSLLTILKWSILSVCKAKGPPLSALFRQAPGWLIVAGQEVQWLLPMQLLWEGSVLVMQEKNLTNHIRQSALKDAMFWACRRALGSAWQSKKNSILTKWSDRKDEYTPLESWTTKTLYQGISRHGWCLRARFWAI